jgi:formate/nitrite transporter FocA (FNT family)
MISTAVLEYNTLISMKKSQVTSLRMLHDGILGCMMVPLASVVMTTLRRGNPSLLRTQHTWKVLRQPITTS